MNIAASCLNPKSPLLLLLFDLVLSIAPHPRGTENRVNDPVCTLILYTAHTSVHMMRIIPNNLRATTLNPSYLPWKLARATHRDLQETRTALAGATILLYPSAHCVDVVTLVRARDALNIVAPPPCRHIRGHPALLVRTPDIVHRVLSALLCSVIPISNPRGQVPSTLELHRSWTSGCANSLRECRPSLLTATHSILPLPCPVGRPSPHPDSPTVAVEAAGVREQSAFAVRSVLVGVREHGGRKETLRVCPSAPQVRFLPSDWAVGTYQLAISLGSSPNTEFPPTGPPRGRRCLGLPKQETLSGVYNHAF